ncbi:MAG: hemolysin-like protein [Proteobacteria bacterium ST_bin14]|nr:MAG: hemolysin-like protein [Proteobacteria bacterium ST_bin14]
MQSIALLPVKPRQMSVRLASCPTEIEAAQRLRWAIFYGDMGARPLGGDERDIDPYDAVCDHLLVEDCASGIPQIVGTYRLLRQSVAEARQGFYSASEFDLACFSGRGGETLELGRSCVAPDYRDSGTIQLLWRGIAAYLRQHRISTLFGCASFHGICPDEHADTLSYLWHNHVAPPELRARALDDRYVDMARLPLGSYDPRQAMRRLPPLIKAYLRVGAQVGDGAVIDHQFNTVDVFIVMPVAAISERYLGRFGAAA